MLRHKLFALAFTLGISVATAAAPQLVAAIVPSPDSPGPQSLVIELAKALAWPVTALVIAAVFRQPLATFVSAVGSRITKLSLFKVELELVPAKPASSLPLFDEIRTAANSATINDSSRMMLEQVQSGEPADYAEIGLGTGTEWLTSRLYIAAVMMERMRGLKCFVFVEHAAATERRFVAITNVSQIRWALARRYPWLEAAWLRSVPSAVPALNTDPKVLKAMPRIIQSDTGAFEPQQARTLVRNFIGSLQRSRAIPAGALTDEWVKLRDNTWERADWVSRDLLSDLIPSGAFRAHTSALPNTPRAQRTRAVLRSHAPYTALVDNERDHELIRVVNRQALLEEVATTLGEELEPG